MLNEGFEFILDFEGDESFKVVDVVDVMWIGFCVFFV